MADLSYDTLVCIKKCLKFINHLHRKNTTPFDPSNIKIFMNDLENGLLERSIIATSTLVCSQDFEDIKGSNFVNLLTDGFGDQLDRIRRGEEVLDNNKLNLLLDALRETSKLSFDENERIYLEQKE